MTKGSTSANGLAAVAEPIQVSDSTQSEASLHALLETVGDCTWQTDAELRITRVCPAAQALLGYGEDELVGKSLFHLMSEDEMGRIGSVFTDAVARAESISRVERSVRDRGGRVLRLETSAVPLVRDGCLLGYLGVDRDVTARCQAESALCEAHELLDKMFLSIDIAVAYMDRDFNFLRVNQAYADAGHRPPEEFIGKNHFDLYPNPENEAIFREVLATGRPYVVHSKPFAYPGQPERGVTYWDWSLQPVKAGADATISGVVLTLNEVTRHILAEQALHQSEEKFRGIATSAHDAIIMADSAGDITFSNPAAARMFGYADVEMLGLNLRQLLADGDRDAVFTRPTDRQSPGASPFACAGLRKDKAEFPVEISVSELCLEGDRQSVVVARDVTERHKAEEALRRSEASLAEAQRIGQLGSWEWDIANGRVYWSDEVYRIFGLQPQQFEPTYETFIRAVHPDDRERVEQAVQTALRENKPYAVDHRVVLSSGEVGVVHERGAVTLGADGRPVHMVGTVQDVTANRRAQQALEAANRALRTLSKCNEALVHALDEETLLQELCDTIVNQGGYQMAWVGFVDPEDAEKIVPAAQAGRGQITAAEKHCGLTREAIRTGQVQVDNDLQSSVRCKECNSRAKLHHYASFIALPLINKGTTFGALNIYASENDAFNQQEIGLLCELANDLAYGLVNLKNHEARDRLEAQQGEHTRQLEQSLVNTIMAIALTIEKRDPYTAGHQQRVAELSVKIAENMKLAPERIKGVRLGALIHDIGKIAIPGEILNRPGRLSRAEFEIIKSHAEVGYEIIKGVEFPWPVGKMVLQHHERIDGSGYPLGLKGDEILLEARILAVADVVEAITSHRPYRPGRGLDEALKEISQNRGTSYDPEVVEACLCVFKSGYQFASSWKH